MGKHAFSNFEVKRSDCLWFNPEDLVLVSDKESPYYDPRVELPVNDSLVSNILHDRQGVLEPVIIVKDGTDPIVIAGKQRVKAACKANQLLKSQGEDLLKIPCLTKKGDEATLFGITLSENENRHEDSMVEKAKKLQRYYNFGGVAKDAAAIFGVSIQSIKMWEKLLDLSSAVIKAIESGQIAASAAVKLASLPKAEQAEKLKEITDKGKPTGKAVGKSTPKPKSQKPKVRSYKMVKQALESNKDLPPQAERVLKWVLNEVDDLPIEWA